MSTTESIYSVGAESVSSAVTCTTEMLGITSETQFILLDLRDEDDYKKWHIRESINFPAPKISQDKTFSELLKFKNKADKLIVVYMLDERQGSHYAKLLHEKGFDNVYLLSGGIEKFIEDHRDLVEGMDVPALPKPKTANTTKTSQIKKTGMGSTQNTFKTTGMKK